MNRPVKCHFCKKPMYYSNDPRHVPEVRIDIVEDGIKTEGRVKADGEYFYAHKKCYRKYFLKKQFLFGETHGKFHGKVHDPKPEDA